MFDTVKMPGSKLKESLASILEREGFIAGYHWSPTRRSPGTTLEIALKYSADRTRTIAGIKRISKPGLRIYARADGIPACSAGWAWPCVSTTRADDRPRSPQAPPRWRGALPCLVAHPRVGEA